jgi:general secretion pathway protein H
MSRAGNNKGFTLIELLVTLALAGLLLSLVPPLLGKGTDRGRLDHDAVLMADKLRLARSKAIASDQEMVVRFDQPLSRGVAITVETPSDEGGILRFYPDGSASGALIRLSNESGSRTLSVDWLTGAIERAP